MTKTYRRYSDEQIILAVNESTSVMDVMRKLGISYISGSMHKHISSRISRLNLDTSHFLGLGWRGGEKGKYYKLSADQVLVVNRTKNGRRERCHVLRRALDEIGRARLCVECGLGESWKEKFLRLETNHINENPLDNQRENLEYLCPNCHSQK